MYETTEILTYNYIKYFDLQTAQYVNFLKQFFLLKYPFCTCPRTQFLLILYSESRNAVKSFQDCIYLFSLLYSIASNTAKF